MTSHDPQPVYPADVAPVARALDRLAAEDARAAGDDLEGRLVRAACEASAPARPLRIAGDRATDVGSATSVSPPRRSWRSAPMRLAAAIAIVGAGVAAWMALRPAPAPPAELLSLEQEVDAWLAMASSDDDLGAEIETLFLLNDDLAETFDSGWIEDDLIGESL